MPDNVMTFLGGSWRGVDAAFARNLRWPHCERTPAFEIVAVQRQTYY
jgi:hypothetical protein